MSDARTMTMTTSTTTSQPQHNAVSDSDNKRDNTVASEAYRNVVEFFVNKNICGI